MKIKRFVAKSMRLALRQVRDEQGPDAVILSNRSVPEGVEVVAAVDYDESLILRASNDLAELVDDTGSDAAQSPDDADGKSAAVAESLDEEVAKSGSAAPPALNSSRFDALLEAAASVGPVPAPVALDLASDPTVLALRDEINGVRSLLEEQLATLVWRDGERINSERARLLRRFGELGLDADIAERLAARTLDTFSESHAHNECDNVLAGSLPICRLDLCDEGGVFEVIGPTGVGKTTTVAKLAARFALKHGRDALALVSTDTFRIGAQEQLATFAQILDVPVHLARDRSELATVLKGLSQRQLILIDTAGVSQRDDSLDTSLALLDDDALRPKRLLALPANVQRDTQNDVIERFGAQPLDGLIVTKLDEAASFGGTFSALLRHDVPVAYLTDGQRVPEDLHVASLKRQWWVSEAGRRHAASGRELEEKVLARRYAEVNQHAHA